MLRNKTPNSANPIVKLFPRLAPVVIGAKVRVQQPMQRNAAARLAKTNPPPGRARATSRPTATNDPRQRTVASIRPPTKRKLNVLTEK